jgi:hypothetical protein
MRMRRPVVFLSFIIALSQVMIPTSTLAGVPDLREQLVYRLSLFDGKGYTQGFVPQSEDTLYLIANENNAVSARVTLVYFWPITGKYVAAFKTLNEEIEGTLEVLRDDKVLQSLEKQDYVLFYPEGFLSGFCQMHVGEDAHAIFSQYEKPLSDFYRAMDAYNRESQEYRENFLAFVEDLEKRKKAGEEISPDSIRAEMPRKPTPPEKPDFDVTSLRQDFILNLPPGSYTMRMRAPDGTILEESQKSLLLFTRRRRGSTGYEIIEGNKWTKRKSCNDPSKIIYAAGENTLYLRPFREDEVNELHYRKLQDPQNEGSSERWIWVHTTPIEKVRLVLLRGAQLLGKIERMPYLVKNIPGPDLGYEILDYTRDGFPDKGPTFEGHRVTLSQPFGSGNFTLWLEDEDGQPETGSTRRVIMVRKERANYLYLTSLFPLLIGFGVFIWRRRGLS